jgi:hypothetical protein
MLNRLKYQLRLSERISAMPRADSWERTENGRPGALCRTGQNAFSPPNPQPQTPSAWRRSRANVPDPPLAGPADRVTAGLGS